MRKLSLSFAIVSVLVAQILGDIPGCNYFDTADLTNINLTNGFYLYEDVLIPKEETGVYDYEIILNGDREPVPSHVRGCVCKLKTCVRFCCHPQKVLLEGQRGCEEFIETFEYSKVLNVTLNNGTQVEKNVMEFMVQQHLPVPCAGHLFLDADYDENHKWTLYENGNLLRHFDSKVLSKRDYCLQPQYLGDDFYQLVPHHCPDPPDVTRSYIQIVSVFFMVLTICVYVLLPNFKGVHYKCCTCYFVCLTMTFILLICVTFKTVTKKDLKMCHFVGYVGYYFTMAAFLWLSIINYNLWKAFNKLGVTQKSSFVYYNIFVWSVAAVLLLIIWLIDLIYTNDSVLSAWIPGVGIGDCWIKTNSITTAIYFYGPIWFLLTINTIFFVITTMRIFVQNTENRQQLERLGRQRNLRNMTNFIIFCRLFAIAGVIWVLEIVSYAWTLYNKAKPNSLSKIFDIITSGQGIMCFAVIILKKDILKALAARILWKTTNNDVLPIAISNKIPNFETNETFEEF